MNKSKITGNSIFYDFGYDKFGPFLLGFIRWLKCHIDKEKYDKVFFFSRDGYMMKKAFDYVDCNFNANEYVYFSRKSLRQALLWKLETYEESLKYLGWERFISVGKVMEYFGFNEDERGQIAKELNLDVNRDIRFDNIKTDNEMKVFFQLKKKEIDDKSKIQAQLLLKYIKQIDLHGKCAIVDIGWHGSMQYYLEMFLRDNDILAEIEGYYVGINSTVPLKSKTNGFLYDENNTSKRKRALCFFGGYERLFQGFEGSTNGYICNSEGIVEPLLAHYEYEAVENIDLVSHIKEWQQGAMDYLENEKCTYSMLSDEQLIKPLIKFGSSPKLSDTRVFSGFYTNDGSRRYFICEKALLKYKPREFIHELSNSQWKTGFLKSAFKLPFPYYLIYEVVRK